LKSRRSVFFVAFKTGPTSAKGGVRGGGDVLNGETSGSNGLGGTTRGEDADVQGHELLGKVDEASLVIDGKDS
jgi:hypothetical protein